MTYAMSDIHGCFNTFKKMLAKINFSSSDKLYILGDVIDRGPYGAEMLKFIMANGNIELLMGNHEYLMVDMMRHNGQWHDRKIRCWTDDNGGKSTYDALKSLSESEREAILDFAESLPYEEKLEVGESRYLLVHGRPNFTGAEREMMKHRHYDSLYDPYEGHFEQVWGHFLPHLIKRDERVIFGHTITSSYSDEIPDRILHRNGNIGLDCGCARRDSLCRLAALRLDDMQEFYEPVDPADAPGRSLRDSDEEVLKSWKDFQYKIVGDTVSIEKFVGKVPRLGEYELKMLKHGFEMPEEMRCLPDASVAVPAEIEGLPVTQLGDDSYGSGVFKGCVGIASVELPSCLTRIGRGAFEGCLALKGIYLPDETASIGPSAFSGCAKLADVRIPDGVKTIGDSAFSGCISLREIRLPAGTVCIESDAFRGCVELKEVKIPEGVEAIEETAFIGCKKLMAATFPASLKSFGRSAFSGTKWLQWKRALNPLVVVNGVLIDGKHADGDVLIPDGVREIGESAFECNKNLTSITAQEGLQVIGNDAFSYCGKLAAVNLPKSVNAIGDGAFDSTPWLESLMESNEFVVLNGILINVYNPGEFVDIPEGVSKIGRLAFRYTKWVEWVRIPEGVTQLDHDVFYWLKGHPKIIAPASLSEIVGGELKFDYGSIIFLSTKSPLCEHLSKKSHRGFDLVPVEEFKADEGKTLFETLEDLAKAQRCTSIW